MAKPRHATGPREPPRDDDVRSVTWPSRYASTQCSNRAARAAAIVLTDEQVELLGAGKKSFPVKVTINRTAVPLRLARMGGENLIGFSKAKRLDAGVDIGSTYRVVIEHDAGHRQVEIVHDAGPRTVEVPDDLAAAMADAGVAAKYEALAPSHRKEYVRWITDAKKPETRERRVTQAVEMIRAGKTR